MIAIQLVYRGIALQISLIVPYHPDILSLIKRVVYLTNT